MDSNATDDLVTAALNGDKGALGRLLLRSTAMLKRRINGHLPPHLRRLVDGDDVLQQTFVRIVRDLKHLREPNQQGFSAWATRVADNCLRDTLRSLRARKRGAGQPQLEIDLADQVGDGSSPSRGARRIEMVQALHTALDTLPMEQRDAVAHVYLHEHSLHAVAHRMGRSYEAVRSLAHRAKLHLRASFGSPSDWL